MKQPSAKSIRATAYLLQISIDQFSKSPTLRKSTSIDLVDLAEANRIRRKLLKQLPKP